MDGTQKFYMQRAMQTYGGGFVSTFADCLARADSLNSARLLAAFPDLVSKYGPGSQFYAAIEALGVNA